MVKKIIASFLALSLLALLAISCSKPQRIVRYGDMLPRSNPENQGVATEGILRFLEEIESQGIELHSFMMLRHGKVIAECWWDPYKATINHAMHSATKTFTSTAIGFAVKEKRLKVTDKVISFFPDDLPDEVSPFLKEMRVKDLLTMSTGQDRAPIFTQEDENWPRLFLAAPVVYEPGTHFLYNSAASHMLSAIITKVTGESTFEYLKPRLFDPLGITDIQWETDPQGITVGGGGMRIKTVDMAKLGLFYLNRGVWEGERLLPASWIEEASSPHIFQYPDRMPAENAGNEGAQGYGYQVWMCSPENIYRADGANGQLILIMPDQDAVVALTARTTEAHQVMQLVWKHLLPVMYNRILPSDEYAWNDKTSLLAGLRLKRPSLTPEDTPLLTDKVLDYKLLPNEQGIEKMTFSFNAEAECLLTIEEKGKTYTFSFGEDNWLTGETDRPGPYYLNPRRNPAGMAPFTVSGYAAWPQKDHLQLRLYYLTDIQYEDLACHFKGEQLTVAWTNSQYPEASPILLSGQLITSP
ncbi:beta-lactamase family protein [Parabacteroides sp. OttesenSCG-928-O15]|nr:beta-lactamase family protein [Parabacteroides sp. OttesenSCG-928-O15]